MSGSEELKTSERMASACVGAVLTSLLVTPLDLVKVRMQSASQRRNACENCVKSNRVVVYRTGLVGGELWCVQCNGKYRAVSIGGMGTLKTFRRIINTEGPTTLWRGLLPTLAMSIPSTVLYFTSYDEISQRLKASRAPFPTLIPMLSGCSARVLAGAVVSPLELIRTRAMGQSGELGQLKSVLRELLRECSRNGIGTLWKGLGPTLWRDVPFSGIYWSAYELCKGMAPIRTSNDAIAYSFLSGAVSGSLAALATCPMDLVKTRRQVNVISGVEPMIAKRFGTLRNIQRIAGEEGVRALFVGGLARVGRVSPACAIMISSYEAFKLHFSDRSQPS